MQFLHAMSKNFCSMRLDETKLNDTEQKDCSTIKITKSHHQTSFLSANLLVYRTPKILFRYHRNKSVVSYLG